MGRSFRRNAGEGQLRSPKVVFPKLVTNSSSSYSLERVYSLEWKQRAERIARKVFKVGGEGNEKDEQDRLFYGKDVYHDGDATTRCMF